jgi:hypothetical protein
LKFVPAANKSEFKPDFPGFSQPTKAHDASNRRHSKIAAVETVHFSSTRRNQVSRMQVLNS